MPDTGITSSSSTLAAIEIARGYARQSMASNTTRAYRADWAHFTAWCDQAGASPLPAEPQVVAAYIASLATTHAPATIQRRLTGIGRMHQLTGAEWHATHPAIASTLKGILRKHGRPSVKAAALGIDAIRRLVATCDESHIGLRDRALLLIGFAGALRRSELVGLYVDDIVVSGDGLRVRIRRAKTDQEGQGAEIGIPVGNHLETCPVRALAAWLAVLGTRSGPLFRGIRKGGLYINTTALLPCAVWDILHKRAAIAGLTVDSFDRLSPHGLRAGFITEAYNRGARDEDIMAHSRHRDLKSMRGYVRRSRLLTDSPAKLVGL